jgi:hypothetical protein
MRDQPLTAEQAARWLECSVEDIQAFVAAGHLKLYAAADGGSDLISLNSVVVLAETLPVERGIFSVRETSFGGDSGYSPKPQGPRPTGERQGFVVERRSPGRRI